MSDREILERKYNELMKQKKSQEEKIKQMEQSITEK